MKKWTETNVNNLYMNTLFKETFYLHLEVIKPAHLRSGSIPGAHEGITDLGREEEDIKVSHLVCICGKVFNIE